MPDAIGPVGLPARGPQPAARGSQLAARGTPGFTAELGGLVEQVNNLQHEASAAVERLALGRGENLHEVMLAVNKAELSFKFLMETRNKLVEAYQEIMRMQL